MRQVVGDTLKPRFFIIYRRQETDWVARGLFDRLSEEPDESSVFMDIDTPDPGADFVDVMKDVMKKGSRSVALYWRSSARNWSTISDRRGTRRMDDPYDFVGLEIATVLRQDVRAVAIEPPVLTARGTEECAAASE